MCCTDSSTNEEQWAYSCVPLHFTQPVSLQGSLLITSQQEILSLAEEDGDSLVSVFVCTWLQKNMFESCMSYRIKLICLSVLSQLPSKYSSYYTGRYTDYCVEKQLSMSYCLQPVKISYWSTTGTIRENSWNLKSSVFSHNWISIFL